MLVALVPIAAGAETSAVNITRAKDGGWDLAIVSNATLSIDGKKIADASAPGYHLNALAPGAHKIEITFADREGKPAVERLMLREPRAKPRAGAPAEPKTIDIAIAGTKVTATGAAIAAGTLRVTQGDLLRLRFQADAAMALHLHGYDIEVDVTPQSPATMVFDADVAGRFAVEKHGGREQRLMFLEVYPK